MSSRFTWSRRLPGFAATSCAWARPTSPSGARGLPISPDRGGDPTLEDHPGHLLEVAVVILRPLAAPDVQDLVEAAVSAGQHLDLRAKVEVEILEMARFEP
ncbi:MAG: hypothetical protein QN187_02140 [Armatimonadota bacterium]|nr:hypothetical protein [Armatimonadota bacterium]